MIKEKITEKLALIVVVVVLFGSLVIQSVQSQNSVITAPLTQYSEALFGDEIITLEIIVDQSKWDEMIANAQAKTYILADVVVNGVTYQNVGVRTKGNASLTQVSQSDSPERYSLRIKFGEYIDGQTCLGLDELVLNNMISDPSYMKEYLSQELMRYIGVEAPLTNYASLSVNSEGIGFYVALESYGESYDRRVFGDNAGEYYNVKTMEMGGLTMAQMEQALSESIAQNRLNRNFSAGMDNSKGKTDTPPVLPLLEKVIQNQAEMQNEMEKLIKQFYIEFSLLQERIAQLEKKTLRSN